MRLGAEWFADAVVHTTGLFAGLIACLALVFLAIRRARTTPVPSVKTALLLALGLYGLGLAAMLICSAVYNLYVDHPLRGLLRRIDHAAIFLMVAGTITPFALLCVRGRGGLKMFAGIWALAAVGIVLKFTVPAEFEYLSIPAYLLLGWAIALAYRPLRAAIPGAGLALLAAGCVIYTLGVAAYLWTDLSYQLAIWHGFVLVGAACHFTCIVGYATGPPCLAAAVTREPADSPARPAYDGRMLQRAIPSTGEMLPLIGLGTYRGFDVGSDTAARARLADVLKLVVANKNALVDSSPMYGRAEDVTGALLQQNNLRDRTFIATKVWTSGKDRGISQMEKSFKFFRTDRIDLMQVHNLVDTRAHLDTLAGWKKEGRVRYVGVTHYHSGAYDELETTLNREKLDFVQLNYSLDDRAAEQRLLPLALHKGIAVIVNVPFGGGGLLSQMSNESLPAFTKEIGAETWAQLLLKFVIGHPAVTVTIPGTGNPKHMAENLAAADGDLASGREAILKWAKARF